MPQHTKKYVLLKRKAKTGHIWYYRLPGNRVQKSTGRKLRFEAEEYVENEVLGKDSSGRSLRSYLEPFFTDQCPHVRRLKEERKSIGDDYVADQRGIINNHILSDPISDLAVADITRGDILDFRSRLVARGLGVRTVNRTIGVIKIAYKEGLYRQELAIDPASGIGNIQYKKKEVGTFTARELAKIFENSPGPFRDHLEYTIFLLAASTGMRRGELLALTWEQIDFERRTLRVDRAIKTRNGMIGEPKWGKHRRTYLSSKVTEALRELRRSTERVLPTELVFGYPDGSMRKATWWRKSFLRMTGKAGLDRVGRNLRPHSFRHSLATLLAEARADPVRVREALGWSGPEIHANYTHVGELSMDQLRDATDQIIGVL